MCYTSASFWGDIMIKEDLKKIREELIKLDDKRKFKDILPKRSCYQEIYEVNKNKLNDTAICYMNSVTTFKQLFSKIYYLAKALTEIGVKEGDSVAISTLATPEGVISFFAVNYIGATANMINVFSGGDREIEEQMRKFNSKVLITQDIFYNKRIRNIMDKVGVTNVVTTGLSDSLPIALNMDKAKF